MEKYIFNVISCCRGSFSRMNNSVAYKNATLFYIAGAKPYKIGN